MNPRNFLGFFKTRSGRLATFGALFATGLIIFSVTRKQSAATNATVSVTPLDLGTNQPQVVESVVRPYQAFYPPAVKVAKPAKTDTNKDQSHKAHEAVQRPAQVAVAKKSAKLLPISLFNDSGRLPRPKQLSAAFAPFGRLIPCETVITVDSSSIQTPIVGLVTKNVYFNGRLIIPAGTEVHGMAQTDRQRDRLASSSSWTLVWQNGDEMRIKALALDREFDNATNQSGWGITDGSAGLRGELIKSDNLADIKLFAATFLSGAANALTEKKETIFGPINAPSLNNAPFQGAQAVLQTYAQRIYDSIKRDGFYVRVPSGKQFYLYVVQTIDQADATLGGMGLVQQSEISNSTQSNQ
jgi:hypothetical protein